MTAQSDLIQFASSKGYRVLFVGNSKLHDYAGMNPEAGQVMGWDIGKHEIYIDESESEGKQTRDLRHELVEVGLMLSGQDYADAHITALKLESVPMPIDQMERLWRTGSYDVEHVHRDGRVDVVRNKSRKRRQTSITLGRLR